MEKPPGFGPDPDPELLSGGGIPKPPGFASAGVVPQSPKSELESDPDPDPESPFPPFGLLATTREAIWSE